MDRPAQTEVTTSENPDSSPEWVSSEAPSAPSAFTPAAPAILHYLDDYLAKINAACNLLTQVAPEAGSDDDGDGRGELVHYLAERIQHHVEDIHRASLDVRQALSAVNRHQTIVEIIGSEAAEQIGRQIATFIGNIGTALTLLEDIANEEGKGGSLLSVRILYLTDGALEHIDHIEGYLLPSFLGRSKTNAGVSRSVH